MLRIHVYGRQLFADRGPNGWMLSQGGTEGKRRPFTEIVVPDEVVTPADLLRYLQDVYHESAKPGRDTATLTEE